MKKIKVQVRKETVRGETLINVRVNGQKLLGLIAPRVIEGNGDSTSIEVETSDLQSEEIIFGGYSLRAVPLEYSYGVEVTLHPVLDKAVIGLGTDFKIGIGATAKDVAERVKRAFKEARKILFDSASSIDEAEVEE